jgi:hypothetical protein
MMRHQTGLLPIVSLVREPGLIERNVPVGDKVQQHANESAVVRYAHNVHTNLIGRCTHQVLEKSATPRRCECARFAPLGPATSVQDGEFFHPLQCLIGPSGDLNGEAVMLPVQPH